MFYGIVVYNNCCVNFGKVDLYVVCEVFICEVLVGGNWEMCLLFLVVNQKMIVKVEELEYKFCWQDVLVDDEFIYVFYDQ